MKESRFTLWTAWTRCFRCPPYELSGMGFEYYRHGTLSLYAALDTKTGRVHGKTAARHTSPDFVEFLGEVVGRCRLKQQIHIILDNQLPEQRPESINQKRRGKHESEIAI